MYNVTQNYLDALKSVDHRFRLRGYIGEEEISQANVLASSLYIKKQCSEGAEVKIGSVYISELRGTFQNVDIARQQWDKKEITLWEGLEIEQGVYEDVPLGVFSVADAVHTASGVQVTAYDNMAKLDKTWPTNTTQGSAYAIYALICHDCGVVGGNTQAEIEAMPNGQQPLSLYTENDIQTYRDALSWLAKTLCAFAYADREGKICLKNYNTTVVGSLDPYHRFKGGKWSDYITRYTGLSVVNIDEGKTEYSSVTPDNGLTYNLGSNPFMQYGTASTRETMRLAVLNGLQAIQYTPFDCNWSSLACYDLGDVLQFPRGLGANSKGCVMAIEWKYNHSTKIKGFGSNPALASAQSKLDKDIAGLMSQTEKDGIQYYTFMNAEEIDVLENRLTPVISIRFTTMSTTKVTWNAEILCDAQTAATLTAEVWYAFNGSFLEYRPTETWINGKHILSLWMVLEVEPNTQYQWQVYLKTTGGKIHIGVEEARAAIWGQGLVSIREWNGYIDVSDYMETFGLDDIAVATFTDSMATETHTPHSRAVEDTFGVIGLDDISVAQIDDYVILNKTSIYLDGMKWEDVYENTWGAIFDEHTW